MGGSHSIYKVTFQRTAVRKKVADQQRRLRAPWQQRRLRGAQQVEGGRQLVPGPSVRLSHSRRLKSQVTFKLTLRVKYLLDVKLSPPDGDKPDRDKFFIKGGIQSQVFEPSRN